MNLLNDKWLPIRRKSGVCELITPWQLTDSMDTDPVESLDTPRPDFNGSLIQFLIALIQTAFPPKDEPTWGKLYDSPPLPEELRDAFMQYEHVFNMDGNGPRFLQDFTLADGERKPISTLLIEEPGANTLRENKDHFIKRGKIKSLGVTSAIAALITLQINAPAGGVGYRTSIRGGGPMTTLLIPDPFFEDEKNTLWNIIWLNVLRQTDFEQLCGNPDRNDETSIFPWLGPTRTSEPKTGRDTTPEDVHPVQIYWSMPRRIRLDYSDVKKDECNLTGREEQVIGYYFAKNYGTNFVGPWRHPLSPYRFDNQGTPLPLHPQVNGLGYRHWLGVAVGDREGVTPAAVVHSFNSSHVRNRRKTKLWVFGYDMDNMKARGWHEARMPFYHLDKMHRELFADAVRDFVEASTYIAENLRSALKRAWFRPKIKVRGDFSFIENSFWQNTEPLFYTLLDELHRVIVEDGDDTDVRHHWFKALNKASIDLFDIWAASGNMEHENPKRIALARRDLLKFNHKKVISTALKLNIKMEGKTHQQTGDK